MYVNYYFKFSTNNTGKLYDSQILSPGRIHLKIVSSTKLEDECGDELWHQIVKVRKKMITLI